jgi:hypothetical protein
MAGLDPAIHALVTIRKKTRVPGNSGSKTHFVLLAGHDGEVDI